MKPTLAAGLSFSKRLTVDEARLTKVEGRRVTFEFSVRDPLEECGRGSHVRFVVDGAKTRERLAAKRARAGAKPSVEIK